jgi:hypothetical protein
MSTELPRPTSQWPLSTRAFLSTMDNSYWPPPAYLFSFWERNYKLHAVTLTNLQIFMLII